MKQSNPLVLNHPTVPLFSLNILSVYFFICVVYDSPNEVLIIQRFKATNLFLVTIFKQKTDLTLVWRSITVREPHSRY